MKILSVVGARPNFMKIAPFIRAVESYNHEHGMVIEHLLVHTGQHYDDRMSRSFFESLGIPDAAVNLGIGSGSHARQVGQTMIAFEDVLLTEQPDWVVVVGDVNATLACSVTAKKLNIRVCHIEAGLRSGDMSMPEEINRLVTDRLSDLLLAPDRLSVKNLLKEGIPKEKICFVGNIMIDTLEANRDLASALSIERIVGDNLLENGILPGNARKTDFRRYAVITLHRPSNVDHRETLRPVISFLVSEVAPEIPVIWPIHPRTLNMLRTFGLYYQLSACRNIYLLLPVGYHEMLRLNMSATVMLTDSGGLQEECCVLGTPCLTLRPNTERPVTLNEYGGVSVLTGNSVTRIRREYRRIVSGSREITCQRAETSDSSRPELWDGHTAMRCVEAIMNQSKIVTHHHPHKLQPTQMPVI
jgi:UDP-N-acetylglucosamine 2-epimerase (non-hydrolysing)